MFSIVIDENVSRDIVPYLQKEGYAVFCILESPSYRGIADPQVWAEAKKRKAILITRDYDFTNPIRFPPEEIHAVIYLRRGNLKSDQEVSLIRRFFSQYKPAQFEGKLITLTLNSISFR